MDGSFRLEKETPRGQAVLRKGGGGEICDRSKDGKEGRRVRGRGRGGLEEGHNTAVALHHDDLAKLPRFFPYGRGKRGKRYKRGREKFERPDFSHSDA